MASGFRRNPGVLNNTPNNIMLILFIVGLVELALTCFLIFWLRPDKRWADIAHFEAGYFQDRMSDFQHGSAEHQYSQVCMADAEDASKCIHPMSLRLRIILFLIGSGLITPQIFFWIQ